jgi:membrane-bound lytic murein transglycosylase F
MRPFLAILAMLSLVFWGDIRWSDRTDSDALFLPGLREEGRLKVVFVPDFGVFGIQEGMPTGFDFKLLKWFADDAHLHLDVAFAPTRLAALDSVRSGKADIACGNFLAEDANGIRFSSPLWEGPMYWMSAHRETFLPGDTLVLLGNSPVNFDVKQWITDHSNVPLQVQTSPSNLFLSFLAHDPARPHQISVAPKWMALAWKARRKGGFTGVLEGTNVKIGWALRVESFALETQISDWLGQKKNSRRYRHWFQTHYARGSLKTNTYQISTLDDWAKRWANPEPPYDAALVLAVAYKESRFQRTAISPAGAVGLMQLMPRTGRKFLPKGGDLHHPESNLRAGINYLAFLDQFWAKRGVPLNERVHFVLASYNTGPAPVVRAHRRARDKGLDPTKWHGNVESVLRSPGRRYAKEIFDLALCYRAYTLALAPDTAHHSIKTGSK